MSMKDDIMAVKKDLEEVKEQSLAMEIVRDLKQYNKRMFIIWLVTFIAFIIALGYTVYLLNDIGTIEDKTEIEQNNEGGYNNYIGNDGDINNG